MFDLSACGIDGHDVGMLDGEHGFHRPDEALAFFIVGGEDGAEHFESNDLAVLIVGGFEDDAGGRRGDRQGR
jgi:hypothetical protein